MATADADPEVEELAVALRGIGRAWLIAIVIPPFGLAWLADAFSRLPAHVGDVRLRPKRWIGRTRLLALLSVPTVITSSGGHLSMSPTLAAAVLIVELGLVVAVALHIRWYAEDLSAICSLRARHDLGRRWRRAGNAAAGLLAAVAASVAAALLLTHVGDRPFVLADGENALMGAQIVPIAPTPAGTVMWSALWIVWCLVVILLIHAQDGTRKDLATELDPVPAAFS